MKPRTLNKHEKMLRDDDPVLTHQKRQEALLQQKLHLASENALAASTKAQVATRKEISEINARIETQFAQLIGQTPGLKSINPAVAEHAEGNQALLSSSLWYEAAGQRTAAPSPRAPLSSRTARGREARTGSMATLSQGAFAALSNYTFGFPTPFEESGFNSATQWASVSYRETQMAALGPRADVDKIRREELPHRLLVSVAAYLLNEVLVRDPALCTLWRTLRDPLYDAIFSPQLIATEMQRRQQQHAAKAARQGKPRGIKETLHGGPSAKEEGIVDPLPLRQAQYESVHDFASYRLWTEEFVSAKKDNTTLAERVEEIKAVVCKSRLVLDVAQRRIEGNVKHTVFKAWHAHVVRSRNMREAMKAYLKRTQRKVTEERAFLKWRRMTLQTKMDDLQGHLIEVSQKLQLMAKGSNNEINALKESLEEAERVKMSMLIKDEALRAQMMETHLLECRILHVALSTKHQQCERIKKHSHRWERLAKTFRPRVLCAALPKAMLACGVRLRRLEDEMSSLPKPFPAFFTDARCELEKLLLRWVNHVMSRAPDGYCWTNVSSIVQRGPSLGSGVSTVLTPHENEIINTSFFDGYALLKLVRELHRLYSLEAAGLKVDGQADKVTKYSMTPNYKKDLSKRSAFESYAAKELPGGGAGGNSPTNDGTTTTTTIVGDCDVVSIAAPLFAELCTVLHWQTSQGLHPSLLMHCPYLGTFFNPSLLIEPPSHPTAMLWVLCALFTGYVQTVCGTQSFLHVQWPKYLSCHNEESLSTRVNPALSTTVTPEQQQQHSMRGGKIVAFPLRAGRGNGRRRSRRGSNASRKLSPSGSPTAAAAPAAILTSSGSFVVSSNTTVGKKPMSSKQKSVMISPDSDAPQADDCALRKVMSSRSFRRERRTMRIGNMEEINLVQEGIDTASDMEYYLGANNDESYMWSEDDDDVNIDGLLEDAAGFEEAELLERRIKHIQEKQAAKAANEKSRLGAPTNAASDGSCFNSAKRHSPEQKSSNADGVIAVEDGGGSGDDEELRIYVSLEDVIRAQKVVDDDYAIRNLSSPKKDLLDAKQLYILQNFPPASVAFDGTFTRMDDLDFTDTANADSMGSTECSVGTPSRIASSFDASLGPRLSKDSSRGLPRVNTKAEDGSKTAIHTFLELTVIDADRRRQWLGLARVVTSLVTRLRVLDVRQPRGRGNKGSVNSETASGFAGTDSNNSNSNSRGMNGERHGRGGGRSGSDDRSDSNGRSDSSSRLGSRGSAAQHGTSLGHRICMDITSPRDGGTADTEEEFNAIKEAAGRYRKQSGTADEEGVDCDVPGVKRFTSRRDGDGAHSPNGQLPSVRHHHGQHKNANSVGAGSTDSCASTTAPRRSFGVSSPRLPVHAVLPNITWVGVPEQQQRNDCQCTSSSLPSGGVGGGYANGMGEACGDAQCCGVCGRIYPRQQQQQRLMLSSSTRGGAGSARSFGFVEPLSLAHGGQGGVDHSSTINSPGRRDAGEEQEEEQQRQFGRTVPGQTLPRAPPPPTNTSVLDPQIVHAPPSMSGALPRAKQRFDLHTK